MKVKELMRRRIISVAPAAPVAEIAQLLRDHDVGCVAVREGTRFLGVVTDRDIVVRGIAGVGGLHGVTATEVMSNRVILCSENEPVEEAERLMREHSVRRLFACNRSGKIVGLISLSDILDAPTKTPVGRVVFYKLISNSYGHVQRVPMTTVFVPSVGSAEDAASAAIRKIEEDKKTRWDSIADGYEVVGMG